MSLVFVMFFVTFFQGMWIWNRTVEKKPVSSPDLSVLNWRYACVGLSYMLAMYFSNAALMYVSYPTQVLLVWTCASLIFLGAFEIVQNGSCDGSGDYSTAQTLHAAGVQHGLFNHCGHYHVPEQRSMSFFSCSPRLRFGAARGLSSIMEWAS